MSQITISYIKEVGNVLASISSVNESTIERNLQAEQAVLPDTFAFVHPTYVQYLTYQHVMLSNLHLEHPWIWEDLVKQGFGGSLSFFVFFVFF